MLTIALLDDSYIEAAGALIAREQTAARQTLPDLPAEYCDPSVCTTALQHLLDAGYVSFVAAEDRRILAVMTGITRDTYARVPAGGFAMSPDLDDPTTVLAYLYGALAGHFIDAGVLRHLLDHIAIPPVGAALANLCFGRHHVYAIQPAISQPESANVRVRLGGVEDLAVITRLAVLEIEHRSSPPIYSAPDLRSLEEITARHRALHESDGVHLIANLDGRDIGLLTIEFSSPAPRICPNGQPYIGPTATDVDVRGQGVGRALVSAALTWAETNGYQWVSVDFEPANPLSRPFWLGSGFCPIGYGALRTIHPAFGVTG